MAKTLSNDELKRLARLGAVARLQELEEERKAILRAFPGVVGQKTRQAPGNGGADGEAAGAPRKTRKRRTVSAAQRKATSERMKKYWAEKKQA